MAKSNGSPTARSTVPEADAVFWSASRIAAAVRRGEVSVRGVVTAFLARLDAINPELNAVITRCDARAKAEADAVDRAVAKGESVGPLAGVPMTIKDLFATEGVRTTFGLPWYRAHVPARDAVAVARLRAAGAIVLGKTNVPIAGYDWQARHPTEGVTHNPHDRTRTCGGSSGGAAAALAAHLTAFELGSDLGGSLRVPAHFCGVWSLKTSEGLLPLEGHGPPESHVEHLCVVGPMARTLDDLRLELDVLEPGNASAATEVGEGLAPAPPTRPLCLAWTDALCGVRADATTRAVLHTTIERLRAAGHTVEHAVPPGWDHPDPIEIWGGVDGFEFRRSFPRPFQSALVRQLFRLGPVALSMGRSPLTRALAKGMAGGPRRWERFLQRAADFQRHTDAWLGAYDALLAPCAATPAFTHRRLPWPIHVDGRRVPYSLAQSAFCCPVNTAGSCAVTVPSGHSEDGLPVGLQWIAARGRDRALLDVVARAPAP